MEGNQQAASSTDKQEVDATWSTPRDHVDVKGTRPHKANLRSFLKKLGRRRRRIPCSRACLIELRRSLESKASGSSLDLTELRELLRSPPRRVPRSVLRDLVDVARAYDSTGCGTIDLQEFLANALDVDPHFVDCLRPVLPLIVMFVWMLTMPIVYAATGGSFVDGLYLGVALMSSVGSSDVVPTTALLKLWIVCYVAVSVALGIWALLGCLNSMLVTYEANLWAMLSPRDNADLLAADGHGPSATALALEELAAPEPCLLRPGGTGSEDKGGAEEKAAAPPKHCPGRLLAAVQRRKLAFQALALSFLAFSLLLAGTLLALFTSKDLNLLDALYWSVLTCTTIGHGDLGEAVSGEVRRGLVLAFMLCAVSGLLFIVRCIGELSLKSCSARMEERLRSRVLPMDFLIDLDANGVGVSKLEFLCAALMTMDKVSAQDLWEVLEEFRRMDSECSGELHCEHLAVLKRKDRALYGACLAVPVEVPEQSKEGLGDVSPVDMEPSSFERTEDPRQRAVHFAPNAREVERSVGEVLEQSMASAISASVGEVTACIPSNGELFAESCVQTDTLVIADPEDASPFVKELYHENLATRKQMDERQSELLQKISAQQCKQQALEEALHQALGERQNLHAQVLLLQQVRAELEAKCHRSEKRLEEAERYVRDLEDERRGRYKAEKRIEELEEKLGEAQCKSGSQATVLRAAEERAQALEERAQALERRAKDAEQRSAELLQQLQDLDHQWRMQVDACVNEVKLQFAEKDLHRQGEVKGALLELQALRGELQRGIKPPPVLLTPTQKRPLLTQPNWEFPRLTTFPLKSGGGLLTGRVREQADLLNAVNERLHSSQESTQPPGFMPSM